MVQVGINGFGRIGRTTVRVWHARADLQKKLAIKVINTSGSMGLPGWTHLLKYDTAYGPFSLPVSFNEHQSLERLSEQDPLLGDLTVGKERYAVLAQRDPAKIPWGTYGVSLVLEATGAFRTLQAASAHFKNGVKKVLLAAPGKGEGIATYVIGANTYNGKDTVADNASCTTNSLAPVIAILDRFLGVAKAVMTTVHGYTDDQKLQDGSHKDLRRARAAAENIIPTSTGAATATTKTLPQLKGLFDGTALRVPVVVGSISDITCVVKKKTTVEEVNKILDRGAAASGGIVATTSDPVVSSDIIGRNESAIVDLGLTQVVDGDLVKVFAWYDNEWGYCNRLLEQAVAVGGTGGN